MCVGVCVLNLKGGHCPSGEFISFHETDIHLENTLIQVKVLLPFVTVPFPLTSGCLTKDSGGRRRIVPFRILSHSTVSLSTPMSR